MKDDALGTLATRYGIADTLTRSVLVVDDEPENLAVLRVFLEDSYTVHEAGSASAALKLLDSTPIDVLITDHRMPGITGVELLEEVHRRWPDIAGIILTAYTDSPVLISAINRARAFRHLKKPWVPEEILAAVAQASIQVQNERLIHRLVDELAKRSDELAGALDVLKAREQQVLHLERLGTMGRLTAGITHDLRNMVQGLAMVEYRLSGLEMPAEVRSVLGLGVAGMGNLLSTLTTINQFASAGRLQIKRALLAPGDVLRDAETVVRMDMAYRERKVNIERGQGLPIIPGDRQKLVQVLVNLIRNALQATQPGQHVWVVATATPDGGVLISVDDEGPGVPDTIRTRLFQAFVSTRGDQGMGMGLYMARLVAESHGGTLRHVPRPGGGTRFELRLVGGEPGSGRAGPIKVE